MIAILLFLSVNEKNNISKRQESYNPDLSRMATRQEMVLFLIIPTLKTIRTLGPYYHFTSQAISISQLYTRDDWVLEMIGKN